jgi:hypothetical protein
MRVKTRICGAVTRRGRPCRNRAEATGLCRLHAGAAPITTTITVPEPGASGQLPPADPAGRLELLQDAAERHALEAIRAGEAGEAEKSDASFNRNARLAATLARARLALSRARGKAGEAGPDDEAPPEYQLPDTDRE